MYDFLFVIIELFVVEKPYKRKWIHAFRVIIVLVLVLRVLRVRVLLVLVLLSVNSENSTSI